VKVIGKQMVLEQNPYTEEKSKRNRTKESIKTPNGQLT
jgi:hypothetical protein